MDCEEARLHYKTNAESHRNEEEFGRNSISSKNFLASKRIGSLSRYEKCKKRTHNHGM